MRARVETELGSAPPHLDRTLENGTRAHERGEHPGVAQPVSVVGKQSLQIGGSRLGQPHVQHDTHPYMVPGPGSAAPGR